LGEVVDRSYGNGQNGMYTKQTYFNLYALRKSQEVSELRISPLRADKKSKRFFLLF